VIAQGSQFGIGTYFMKFSREYEQQADILGSHIMASAGYDPRDMANVFKTIQQENGAGAPQWMSDHPDPGNRYEYINREARMLNATTNARRDTPEFQSVRSYLRGLAPAPTTEEVARNRNAGRTTGGNASVPDSRPNPGSVSGPDSRFTTYNEGDLFRVSVPSNWREMGSNDTVTFAPEGAYGSLNGQGVFTHGVQIGVSRNEAHDLQTATDELIQSLRQANPRLSGTNGYQRGSLGGRPAVHTLLSNVSDVTGGQEVVDVYTADLNGSLFYVLGVAPRDQYNAYANIFGKIAKSIQFVR
jgi:hypothetical protein